MKKEELEAIKRRCDRVRRDAKKNAREPADQISLDLDALVAEVEKLQSAEQILRLEVEKLLAEREALGEE